MKMIIAKFNNGLLSKEQMRAVRGGMLAESYATCNDGMGHTSKLECGPSGACESKDDDANGNGGYCKCGSDYKTCNPV